MSSYISKTTKQIFSCVKIIKNNYLIGGIIILYIFFSMNKKSDNKVLGGNNSNTKFILYYVEWCPHCKRLYYLNGKIRK